MRTTGQATTQHSSGFVEATLRNAAAAIEQGRRGMGGPLPGAGPGFSSLADPGSMMMAGLAAATPIGAAAVVAAAAAEIVSTVVRDRGAGGTEAIGGSKRKLRPSEEFRRKNSLQHQLNPQAHQTAGYHRKAIDPTNAGPQNAINLGAIKPFARRKNHSPHGNRYGYHNASQAKKFDVSRARTTGKSLRDKVKGLKADREKALSNIEENRKRLSRALAVRDRGLDMTPANRASELARNRLPQNRMAMAA